MLFSDVVTILRLDQPGQTVLVVEDHVPWLIRLSEHCRAMGHQVVSMLGVESVEDGIASGAGLEAPQEIDLRTVDVAFLDHYFMSKKYNGATFARELRACGQARIFGMSSDAAANASMARMGADVTLRKAELMRILPL